jgi:hypothetical protein
MVSIDNLHNQPALKKKKNIVRIQLNFYQCSLSYGLPGAAAMHFSNGIFFKEMLSALIDNNLLSVATLIHSLSINCLIPEQ